MNTKKLINISNVDMIPYTIKLETVGADPEFFLENDKGVFPVVGLIKGTKEDPQPIGKGFFIQRDGLLAEGNIPPAKSKQEFIAHMKHLKGYINDIAKTRGLRIAYYDSARFTPRFMKLAEAYEFGCDPYQMAWSNMPYSTTQIVKLNQELASTDRRPAGFHIHIGFTHNGSEALKQMVVRLFDLFVTNPLRQISNDPFRAKYYGGLGSYRGKTYGVECRSLGSQFTQDQYLGFIWDQIEKMFEYINSVPHIVDAMMGRRHLSVVYRHCYSGKEIGLIDNQTYKNFKVKLEEQLFKKELVYA